MTKNTRSREVTHQVRANGTPGYVDGSFSGMYTFLSSTVRRSSCWRPAFHSTIKHHLRTFKMDVVISEPSPEQIKVLPHNQYHSHDTLSPTTVAQSPLDQFHKWFKEAAEHKDVHEPEIMTLSTATPEGIPSARMVLFKQLDPRGFTFFTNYTSRKSRELESNPHAALVFYWAPMHRSVRVIGRVEKVSHQQSEDYFKSRPVGSRLGAWASHQSSVVAEGEVQGRLHKLEERLGVTSDQKDGSVPLPEFWGGWRIIPR